MPHIFDRFYQDDAQRTGGHQGTGIGLALVHELVHRLEGDIQVASQVGGHTPGTQFVLHIPIQPVSDLLEGQPVTAPSLQVELPPRVHESAETSPRADRAELPLVLLVEDEGWIIAKEDLPELVVSDLMMPHMDGYSLIERLKTDPATDHIAVILLTGNTEADSRYRGLTYGADDYLTKPFHMGELKLRLRNLVERQQKLRTHYRHQLTQTDQITPLPSLSDQFLRRFYGLIEQRLDDSSLSVDWLADQLAMSRQALNKKVQSLTNLSPVDLIRQYRLRKAINLLRFGHNASETAYMVGFESPSYFTRVFRQYYQQTPTDFVKR